MGKRERMKVVGKVATSGTMYMNELFGIKLTLPKGFSFYDEGRWSS